MNPLQQALNKEEQHKDHLNHGVLEDVVNCNKCKENLSQKINSLSNKLL